MKILVINGPNLNLLGKRKPEVYGSANLADLEDQIRSVAKTLDIEATCYQSNHEGEIVDRLATALNDNIDAIVINPAAYTHTSIAIRDAIEAIQIPTIEVHISNVHSREEFRHTSLSAPVCMGQIAGLGFDGYEMAMRTLKNKINNK